MRTLEAIDKEIATLTQRRHELANEYDALEVELASKSEPDTDRLQRLPDITAQMNVIARRLGLLKGEREEATAQAQLAQYEELLQKRAAYRKWLETAQAEIAALDEKKAAIQAEIKERETVQQGVRGKSLNLQRALLGAGKAKQAKALNEQYQ